MEELYYKALGDSITTGVGAIFSKGFVSKYARFAVNELGIPIRTETIAKNRLTSSDLLYRLQEEGVQSRLMYGNIYTITIGGNDLLQANRVFNETMDPAIFDVTAMEFRQNIANILAEIHFVKKYFPSPYMVRLIGLYNPLPYLPYSDFWIIRFNQILQSFDSETVKYVDLYRPFIYGGQQLLTSRGIHPNRHGYQVIAEQAAKVGFKPFK
ncbi:GDSL-type esterase/lipase family protein [Bacillaceae bacterium W0354]